MPKTCGKQVNTLHKSLGVARVRLSPACSYSGLAYIQIGAQPGYPHIILHSFTQSFPHQKNRFLSLIEHYFYPVSTAPIISITQKILKKGL
jgi:hypothetical protein